MGNCQKSFGITIRLFRLSRKLKQEQLAEKSGLSLRVKELFALEEIRRSPKGIGKDLLAQLENCKESELLRFYACNKILLSKYK